MPGGSGFPVGFVLVVVVATASVAAGATRHPLESLVALAVAAGVVAAVADPAPAFGTAVFGWYVYDGFVLGRRGELVFTPDSATAAVVLASAVAAVVGWGLVREVVAGSTPPLNPPVTGASAGRNVPDLPFARLSPEPPKR
ncbi:hypothetical protein GCM10023214_28440 [Amycolatopsis dongchuanensis]|uniref:DUF4126 domain-containing protein n=1 Tax=Amycolatopsis dongchuanensis TaxID=1070866 RepID=A0ABP9QHW6_9PSEU